MMQQVIDQVKQAAAEAGIYERSCADNQKLLCYAAAGEMADFIVAGDKVNAQIWLGITAIRWVNRCHFRNQPVRTEEFELPPFVKKGDTALVDELFNSLYYDFQVERAIGGLCNYLGIPPLKVISLARCFHSHTAFNSCKVIAN